MVDLQMEARGILLHVDELTFGNLRQGAHLNLFAIGRYRDGRDFLGRLARPRRLDMDAKGNIRRGVARVGR